MSRSKAISVYDCGILDHGRLPQHRGQKIPMRRLVSGTGWFRAARAPASSLIEPGARPASRPGPRLNQSRSLRERLHGVQALYTNTMVNRQTFTINDHDLRPTLEDFEITRDRFLKPAPATAARPESLTHGAYLANLECHRGSRAQREGGRPSNRPSKSTTADRMDPNGV